MHRLLPHTRFTGAIWGAALIAVLTLTLALAGCASSPIGGTSATEAPSPPSFFALSKTNPILPHGPRGAWDDTYEDPGAMIYANGQFYMFHNGIKGWPMPVGVGLATSKDGVHWTRQGATPVFLSKQVPYAHLAIFVTSVLIGGDGTWSLYFYTANSSASTELSVIGRATAPAPTGPWTADPAPLLTAGASGAWDSGGVVHPTVLRTSSGYVMYYQGSQSLLIGTAIGRATSPDGIHWQKDANPVLTPGQPGSWDETAALSPAVEQTPDGWVMVYLTYDAGTNLRAFGYATSPDGMHWRKAAVNPILSTQNRPDWVAMYLSHLVYHAGVYYLYFDLQRAGQGATTNVYLATYAGHLS